MTAMDHKMKEFLKEYDEELLERTLESQRVQECVDRAEELLSKDWDAVDVNELFEPYPDEGHDDFGHEYNEDEEDPFPFDYEVGKYDDLEEEHNP
jgi:hypothetical protein